MAGKEDRKAGSEKFKNQPGNRTPNPPNQKERMRGHSQEQHRRRGKRQSSER